MPLYRIDTSSLISIKPSNFDLEKKLQQLIENSLPTVFGARFVATEFSTGSFHGGRIDTLALSENNNPIIIEYKKMESSELINQSLYYLFWLQDHQGDFNAAARRTLCDQVKVDWSDPRVICLAPKYKKFDLLAVKVMGVNIELWQYHLFADGHLYLEPVFRRTSEPSAATATLEKDSVMVAAGKKAAITRANATYTFEQHLQDKSTKVQEPAVEIQEYISGLDEAIQEVPLQNYVAYKIVKNFVCMEVRPQQGLRAKIRLDLRWLAGWRHGQSRFPCPRSGCLARFFG